MPPIRMMPRAATFSLLLLFAIASVCAGISFGSVPINAREILGVLAGSSTGPLHDILFELRLPRVVAAFSCGGLLALAGALLQVLLRNPLADPYIFGVSGGAALGVLTGMLMGLGLLTQTGLGLGGALAALLLVFGLSFRSGDWNPYRLLLTGVVVAAGLGALLSLILVLAPQTAVKGMLFWLMGDLSHARNPWPALAVLVLLLAATAPLTQAMNVLALGRDKAHSLGVAVTSVEIMLYLLAAVATLTAVLVGGTIGFVGLIVPHLVRLLGLADHRWLLPAVVFAGGGLLVLADTAARSVWAPTQLPVGVLTALLGVPVLLLLLSGKSHVAR